MRRDDMEACRIRGAGVLLPVSALPSPYGIGTLGNAAYRFIDQLHAAGQTYWQVLPIGPTGFGNSPYQSYSAFAGNPYFIDLDRLAEQGLLTQNDILKFDWGENRSCISYDKIENIVFNCRKQHMKTAIIYIVPIIWSFVKTGALVG
ncbi:MAG: 4-alpha-glucanotransferase [Acutalibacteraceae bacterium]